MITKRLQFVRLENNLRLEYLFSQYGFLKSLHWIRFEIESVQAVRGLNFIMLYTFYFITNLGQVEIRTEASPESINNAVITIGWTKTNEGYYNICFIISTGF